MAQAQTISDLDQRLLADRAVVAHRLDALRVRLRREARDLSPRRMLKRHATLALAVALVTALGAGYAVGRATRTLARLF